MSELSFKGGYGEHGRSCFVIEDRQTQIMIDCGIMEQGPNPNIKEEDLPLIDYMLVTHCHNDHIGAFNHFVKHGFKGELICAQATYDLSKIHYSNKRMLSETSGDLMLNDEIKVSYGCSGHCPGALWYLIQLKDQSYFFSGDFQQDTLSYLVDIPENIHADIAVVDCAHKASPLSASQRRASFMDVVKENLKQGKKVILPSQGYGRGTEMLIQLLSECKNYKVSFDQDFKFNTLTMLNYPKYFKTEAYDILTNFLEQEPLGQWDILLLGDTYIEKEISKVLVTNAIKYSALITTGRIRKGSMVESLMEHGLVIKRSYSHHQSEVDMYELLEKNHFKVVFPFHNNEREVIVK